MELTKNTFSKDWSLSSSIAGFLAVLISYSGPMILYFQAAQVAGVSSNMTISWIFATSIGAAIAGIFLSVRYKVPIITAWSAPGTVLLIALFPEMTLNEAVGAYLITGLFLIVLGVSGYFDKILQWIPQTLAAGVMAGILFQFGVKLFHASEAAPIMVFSMLGIFFISRKFSPRYSIIWVLLVGTVVSFLLGEMNFQEFKLSLGVPEFITPSFTVNGFLNLAIPLIIVTLSGQFLPGMMMIRVSGYSISAKPILVITGIASLLVAFFGGITIALASITAAICLSKESHDDPKKRYIAGISNGVFYFVGAIFAGSIVMLFNIFPKEMVAALAGLALLGAISANLSVAMRHDDERDAALIAFLVTVSGISFFQISSVLWGSVIGIIAHLFLSKRGEKKS